MESGYWGQITRENDLKETKDTAVFTELETAEVRAEV